MSSARVRNLDFIGDSTLEGAHLVWGLSLGGPVDSPGMVFSMNGFYAVMVVVSDPHVALFLDLVLTLYG